MLKEFKEFAIKGNMVDMAVGIMIGAAFGSVVNSIVKDLLTPFMALLTGGLDFGNKFIVLREGTTAGPYLSLPQAQEGGAVVLSYGVFINALISFLLVALALFFIVRWINRLRRPDTPPAPNTRPCPFCMSHIHIAATRCPECTSAVDEAPAT